MSAHTEPPGRARSAQVDAGASVSSNETTRRIITGHDENGRAVFLSDEVLKTANPYKEDLSPPEGTIPGFTLIHRAEGFPTTSVNDPVTEWHGRRIPLSNAGGTVCRVVDFPPIGENGDAFMHRTQSVDFGVILKGSIKLILDDGLEKTMSEGDVVVQRQVSTCFSIGKCELIGGQRYNTCVEEREPGELQGPLRSCSSRTRQGRKNRRKLARDC